MKENLEDWYKLRAEIGKDVSCDFSINTNYSINQSGPLAEIISQSDYEVLSNESVSINSGKTGLIEKKDELSKVENELASKLAELEQKISSCAASMGITFDANTGNVSYDNEMIKNGTVSPELENIAYELGMKPPEALTNQKSTDVTEIDDSSLEHSVGEGEALSPSPTISDDGDIPPPSMPVATGGGQPDNFEEQSKTQPREEKTVKDMVKQTSLNPVLVQQINEVKEELLDRDVKAKKILDARRHLETVKDKMDFETALYIAKKHAMQLEIAQMQVAIMGAIKSGDGQAVAVLQKGIQSVTDRIKKLENDFAQLSQAHRVDFDGAIMSLEEANKSYESIRRQNTMNKSVKEAVTYSEGGIMNGTEVDMMKNGITVHEKEICDERGIIIMDVADVISRSTSFNIEGEVVEMRTSASGDNIEDSMYIDGVEKINIETDGDNRTISESKTYDSSLANSRNENEVPTCLNRVNRGLRDTYLTFGEKVLLVTHLAMLADNDKMKLQRTLRPFYANRETGRMDNIENFGKSLDELGIINETLEAIALEKSKDMDEVNPYEEIPFDQNENNSSYNN